MKKMLLVFGLVSIGAFANANDHFTPEGTGEPIKGLTSSISLVWEVTSENEGVLERKEQINLASVTPVTSILCLYPDGEYTIGNSSDPAVVSQMYNHCRDNNGTVYITVLGIQ